MDPAEIDIYSGRDAELENILSVFGVLVLITWLLVICRNTIRLQELRSSIDNRSWIWLPGLTTYATYVSRVSREHLEKILSSKRELPSKEVPQVTTPLILNSAKVEDTNGTYTLSCKISSFSNCAFTVDAFWMLPMSSLKSLVETNEDGRFNGNALNELYEKPHVQLISTTQPSNTSQQESSQQEASNEIDPATNREAPPRRLSSFLFNNTSQRKLPDYKDTGGSDVVSNPVPVVEREFSVAVPMELVAAGPELAQTLSGTDTTIAPLFVVAQVMADLEMNNEKGDVSVVSMAFVLNFDRSLQARISRQLCFLSDTTVIEMLEVFGMDASNDCVICLCEETDTMLLPCRHVCVCAVCFRELDKCPICRAEFDTFITIKQNETVNVPDSTNPHSPSPKKQSRRRLKFWRSKRKKG